MPDLTVSVSQRRWSCVLDPALALATPFGAALVRRLATLMDVWMVRSFWQVLDSSEYFQSNPRALGIDQDPDVVRAQLQAWERIRARTDLAGLRFFWIGDNHSESRLPEVAEADWVPRYERLCQSLERRRPTRMRLVHPALDERSGAAIEIAAIAGLLHPVVVITPWPRAESGMPRLCRELSVLGLECRAVALDGDVPLATIERDYLNHLLVHAGATPWFCAGLRLAALHILAPDAASAVPGAMEDSGDTEAQLPAEVSGALGETIIEIAPSTGAEDLWSGAQVFWYPLAEGAAVRSAELVGA